MSYMSICMCSLDCVLRVVCVCFVSWLVDEWVFGLVNSGCVGFRGCCVLGVLCIVFCVV